MPGPARKRVPKLSVERALWDDGHDVVVGVDEVGRGAWAGPIMVGVAVLPRDRRVYRVRDSKMLPEHERERLFDRIASWCVTWAVGGGRYLEGGNPRVSAAPKLAASPP